MDKSKAQSYLDKINSAFAKLPAQPHDIDVDSLLGYVRIFYSSLKEMLPEHVVRLESAIVQQPQPMPKEDQSVSVNDTKQPETTTHEPIAETPIQPAVEEQPKVVDKVVEIARQPESDVPPTIPESSYNNIVESLMEAESGSGVQVSETTQFVEDVVDEAITIAPNDVKTVEPIIEPSIQSPIVDENPAYTQMVPELQPTPVAEVVVPEPIKTAPEVPVYEPVEIEQPKVVEIVDTPSSQSYDSESSTAIESLFRESSPTGLVDFLGLSPLDNLNKAWGLNERMLVIKDLFGNDLQVFENTIQMLNKLTSFDEAKHYLVDHVVSQFEWYDLSKTKKAKDFIKQVKRLFAQS